MIFNFQQIQEIISILKRNELAFLAKQLGLNYLTQGEINLLSASGIDLTKFTDSKGYIEYAYIFGIWADALGDKRTKNMTFRQFKDFMKSSNFIPLTEEEEFALKQLKTRAYTDITGLGSRIVGGTTNIIVRGNQQQQAQIRDIIKKKTIRAYELRQSSTKLASDLGHATQDWGRDWLRIAKYLMHSAFNTGKAQNILKNYGNDVEVYFDVYPKACRRCKELYLTDPDDENSQPKIFKLTDIIANGNNIGRKADDWLPTLDPIHPYCFASKATKIYTVDGWRNISDIRVGDLVLTHKNRFRKVTALSRRPYQGENLYTIYYAYTDVYRHRQIRKVKHITGNHPILTTDGWRKVEELQIKDKVFLLQNIFNNHEGNFEQISVNVVYVKKEENKKQCKTLYNFAVEEDESYVADGIVVHNCRCTVNRYNPKYEWNPKTHAFSTLKKVKLNKQVQAKLGKQSLRDLIKVSKT